MSRRKHNDTYIALSQDGDGPFWSFGETFVAKKSKKTKPASKCQARRKLIDFKGCLKHIYFTTITQFVTTNCKGELFTKSSTNLTCVSISTLSFH